VEYVQAQTRSAVNVLQTACTSTCSQPLTCVTFNVDVDENPTVSLFCARLTRSSFNSDAFRSSWHVYPSTRAFEDSFLDPALCAVKVALILDLETETALSFHELCNCLCRKIKRIPSSATATLSAMGPQEGFELSRKSFRRLGLGSKHTHLQYTGLYTGLYTALHLCDGGMVLTCC
jgi:hypothetical protein